MGIHVNKEPNEASKAHLGRSTWRPSHCVLSPYSRTKSLSKFSTENGDIKRQKTLMPPFSVEKLDEDFVLEEELSRIGGTTGVISTQSARHG